MDYQYIKIEFKKNIALLILNHPETLNAVSLQMIRELNGKDSNAAVVFGRIFDYHKKHRQFPPSRVASKQKELKLSWRVEILPYLGKQELYDKFDHKKSWDSDVNKALLSQMPDVFRSFGDRLPHAVRCTRSRGRPGSRSGPRTRPEAARRPTRCRRGSGRSGWHASGESLDNGVPAGAAGALAHHLQVTRHHRRLRPVLVKAPLGRAGHAVALGRIALQPAHREHGDDAARLPGRGGGAGFAVRGRGLGTRRVGVARGGTDDRPP